MKQRLLLTLLPLALAACSPTPPSNPADTAAPSTTATTAAVATTPEAAMDTSALGQYHWRLSEATDKDGKRIDALFAQADKPLQLDFAEGRLSVSNACNRIGGSYQVEAGKLQVGQMMHTMMACPDPAVMALDDAIDQRLRDHPALTVQTSGGTPQLRLLTAGGDQLLFDGQPTAETRYGGTGETVFMEVAAQTKPCSHPLIADHQCLQVRERHYDANGLRSGTPGDWQPLYQDIEGYTHEPGIRNVLRLKRYTIKNPPADGSSVAYVLDMVVESANEKP